MSKMRVEIESSLDYRHIVFSPPAYITSSATQQVLVLDKDEWEALCYAVDAQEAMESGDFEASGKEE